MALPNYTPMLEKQDPTSIQRLLNAHVESSLLQATIKLHLLEPLRKQPHTPEALAEIQGYDVQGVTVILRGLASLGLVSGNSQNEYQLSDKYRVAFDPEHDAFIGPAAVEAAQFWDAAAEIKKVQFESLLCLALDRLAPKKTATNELIELLWGYAWTASLMALAELEILEAAERGCYRSDLISRSSIPASTLDSLLTVGQRCGVLHITTDEVTLTEAAHVAFGKGTVKNHIHWIGQRLLLDRQYFWHSLGQLMACVSSGKPASKHSSPGENDTFRRAFIRVNQPLRPLLQQVSDKVALALKAQKRPFHILEIGAGIGNWGMALANAHTESQVTAVDTESALAETQRIVAHANLSERYIWQPDNIMTYPYEAVQYDLVVLNEVMHTIPPLHLPNWLTQVTKAVKPSGLLLIADMMLDNNYAGPHRHLLAGVKLFVSGGGQLLSMDDHRSRLQQVGLSPKHMSRLPVTDLIIARNS